MSERRLSRGGFRDRPINSRGPSALDRRTAHQGCLKAVLLIVRSAGEENENSGSDGKVPIDGTRETGSWRRFPSERVQCEHSLQLVVGDATHLRLERGVHSQRELRLVEEVVVVVPADPMVNLSPCHYL